MVEKGIEISANLFKRVVYQRAYSDELFDNISLDADEAVDFVKFAMWGTLRDYFFIERMIKSRSYLDLSSKKNEDFFKSLLFVSIFLLKNSTLVKEIVVSVTVDVCKKKVNLHAAKMVNAILRRVLREGLYERDFQYLMDNVFYFQKLSEEKNCDKIIEAIYNCRGDAPGGYFVDSSVAVDSDNFVESDFVAKYYYTKNFSRDKNYEGFVFQDISNYRLMNFFLDGLDCGGGKKIFEACAYPGGKSFRLKKFFKDSMVVYNDVLTRKSNQLKARLFSGLFTISDASQTPFRDNSFDYVFADVPCSGSGVVKKKPEIMLTLNRKKLDSLLDTQKKILDEASRIAKIGGKIFYSTCSLFSCENMEQINSFLRQNKNFILVSQSGAVLAANGEYFFDSSCSLQSSDAMFGAVIEKRS